MRQLSFQCNDNDDVTEGNRLAEGLAGGSGEEREGAVGRVPTWQNFPFLLQDCSFYSFVGWGLLKLTIALNEHNSCVSVCIWRDLVVSPLGIISLNSHPSPLKWVSLILPRPQRKKMKLGGVEYILLKFTHITDGRAKIKPKQFDFAIPILN